MRNVNLLGPWIRRFLMEHMVGERNLALNTRASYRDTLVVLLPFVAAKARRPVDRLSIEDVSTQMVRLFLRHLEESRGCCVATRNQRLAAIHALASFVGTHSPEHLSWCAEIRGIPFKKAPKPVMAYLEKSEMEALLEAPDRDTALGFRDYAILLFLYNTGARADEAAHVTIKYLSLENSPSVKILGKGNKVRYCPLWSLTAHLLKTLIDGRAPEEPAFLNRRKQPITRFGIHALVKRYVLKVSQKMRSLSTKRVSAHTIRHTTAVHLLRSGVDINTVRAWLGHVSLDTTHIYAEIDLEMKAKALAQCEIAESAGSAKHWRENPGLMAFLKTLSTYGEPKFMLPTIGENHRKNRPQHGYYNITTDNT